MGNLCLSSELDPDLELVKSRVSSIQESALSGDKASQWQMHLFYANGILVKNKVVVQKSGSMADWFRDLHDGAPRAPIMTAGATAVMLQPTTLTTTTTSDTTSDTLSGTNDVPAPQAHLVATIEDITEFSKLLSRDFD